VECQLLRIYRTLRVNVDPGELAHQQTQFCSGTFQAETAAGVADIVSDNTAAIALNSPDVRPHVRLDVV
jgi:hypothetical protein